mmetsp:Transcript_22417/g.72455  ORF Transcript_22417/g.72455 Transcript_22417/m.72455 type:complete len:265 (-) Transcript_22417:486-1280(-)
MPQQERQRAPVGAQGAGRRGGGGQGQHGLPRREQRPGIRRGVGDGSGWGEAAQRAGEPDEGALLLHLGHPSAEQAEAAARRVGGGGGAAAGLDGDAERWLGRECCPSGASECLWLDQEDQQGWEAHPGAKCGAPKRQQGAHVAQLGEGQPAVPAAIERHPHPRLAAAQLLFGLGILPARDGTAHHLTHTQRHGGARREGGGGAPRGGGACDGRLGRGLLGSQHGEDEPALRRLRTEHPDTHGLACRVARLRVRVPGSTKGGPQL